MTRPSRKPRRKPRKCRNCGKPLRSSKTGYYFFCPPIDGIHVCREKYMATHEPDVDPAGILRMRPTDEDNYGVSMADLRREEF